MAKVIASPDEFQILSTQYSQRAADIQQLTVVLTNMINNAEWRGNARENFINDWNTHHRSNLARLQEQLDALSTELRSRAAATVQYDTRA